MNIVRYFKNKVDQIGYLKVIEASNVDWEVLSRKLQEDGHHVLLKENGLEVMDKEWDKRLFFRWAFFKRIIFFFTRQ